MHRAIQSVHRARENRPQALVRQIYKSTERYSRDLDAGIVVVLGSPSPLKQHFCDALATRLEGGVLSLRHVIDSLPSDAKEEELDDEGRPSHKVLSGLMRMEIKRAAWRFVIISDFCQSRDEVRRSILT